MSLEEFRTICRSLGESNEVTVTQARKILIGKTIGQCPATVLVDSQTGTIKTLKQLCEDPRIDSILSKYITWPVWMRDVNMLMKREEELKLMDPNASLPCLLLDMVKNEVRQYAAHFASMNECPKFRAFLMHSTKIDVRAIHFFHWDGSPRKTTADIVWALCHYSSTDVRQIIKSLALGAGAVVAVGAADYALRLAHRKMFPLDDAIWYYAYNGNEKPVYFRLSPAMAELAETALKTAPSHRVGFTYLHNARVQIYKHPLRESGNGKLAVSGLINAYTHPKDMKQGMYVSNVYHNIQHRAPSLVDAFAQLSQHSPSFIFSPDGVFMIAMTPETLLYRASIEKKTSEKADFETRFKQAMVKHPWATNDANLAFSELQKQFKEIMTYKGKKIGFDLKRWTWDQAKKGNIKDIPMIDYTGSKYISKDKDMSNWEFPQDLERFQERIQEFSVSDATGAGRMMGYKSDIIPSSWPLSWLWTRNN